MRFCQEHWTALRAGVLARGMWHLVAGSGAELGARIYEHQEEGTQTARTFDPLFAATMAIYGKAIQGGLYLMNDKPDGEPYCPLCELDAHLPPKPADGPKESVLWIDGCLDAQRQAAQDLGLILLSS